MRKNTLPQAAEGAELRELISCLMDGELDGDGRRACLDRLCADDRRRADWTLWHAAGDALRSTEVAALQSGQFADRVALRLAKEPAIIAPGTVRGNHRVVRRIVMPGAAAAAAVVVLAFVAVPMLRGSDPAGVEVARVQGASQPAGPAVPAVASVSRGRPVLPIRRPSPVDAERFDLYLAAHGQVSGALGMPRTSQYLRQGDAAQSVPGSR